MTEAYSPDVPIARYNSALSRLPLSRLRHAPIADIDLLPKTGHSR